MTFRRQTNMAGGQRGYATVEMAIALPLLLLLLFGTAEFGRMISQINTLHKAVRDGARYAASVSPYGTTGLAYVTPLIQLEVTNLVVTGNINGTGPPLLPGLTPADVKVSIVNTDYVQVSVTYTYEPITGVTLQTFGIGGSMPLAVPLAAACVMRVL